MVRRGENPICASNPAAKKFRIFCHNLPNMCYNSTGILAVALRRIPCPRSIGKGNITAILWGKENIGMYRASPRHWPRFLLAGCGATVDLNEQATAETAMAVQWVPNGSVYATAAEELEYWSTAQKLESALAATRETAHSVDLNELLDEFCAAQPGSFFALPAKSGNGGKAILITRMPCITPPACSSCPMRSGCAARPMPEHWTWKMNCPTSSAAVCLIRRCKPITMPRPSRPKPPCVL